jgi:hypothetical protein
MKPQTKPSCPLWFFSFPISCEICGWRGLSNRKMEAQEARLGLGPPAVSGDSAECCGGSRSRSNFPLDSLRLPFALPRTGGALSCLNYRGL